MRGAIPEIASQSISTVLEYVVEEIHIRACETVFTFKMRRARRKRWLRRLDRAKLYTLISSQLLLSPLAISAALQRLGLVTSIPASHLLPWSPLSPLRWAWLGSEDTTSTGATQIIAIILSPTFLWCLSNTLYNIIASTYGSSSFVPEELILGPEDHIRKPKRTLKWSYKEAPQLLKPLVNLRDSILHRLGWSEKPQPRRLIEATETGDILDNGDGTFVYEPKRTHRRTELARFPSHFLALNLDSLLGQLLFLPLESLYLRSMVTTFLASPLATRRVRCYPSGARYYPMGVQYYDVGLRYYRLGKGPLGALLNRDAGVGEWRLAGDYASKLGLCVALQFGIDTAIWGAAQVWTRWMGVTRFHWGAV